MSETIVLDGNKTIILIDASYYVFYRYFATMRWFTFQKIEFEINKITENLDFISSFIKHLDSDMKKLCKKWKTHTNNILFCSDCQRCKIWRNDIYKEYKGTRVQNTNFNGEIFNVFSAYIEKMGFKRISFDRMEADDIIYLLQKEIRFNGNSNIVIITNDNDYLQLADGIIHIINMQMKDIAQRGEKNPKLNLYNKAIYGDKSDNIPKIASFITKEKALQIASMDEKELFIWLKQNNLIEKFNFNMNLISFERIPKEYIHKFQNQFKICLLK